MVIAARDDARGIGERRDAALDPVEVGEAVVVGEGEDFAAGSLMAAFRAV